MLTGEVLMHFEAGLEEDVEGRRVMIFPGEAQYFAAYRLELSRVVGTPGHIENKVVLAVLFPEKIDDIAHVVAVHGFEAAGWETHRQYTRGDIGNIEVVLVVSKTTTLPTHDLTKPIHFTRY